MNTFPLLLTVPPFSIASVPEPAVPTRMPVVCTTEPEPFTVTAPDPFALPPISRKLVETLAPFRTASVPLPALPTVMLAVLVRQSEPGPSIVTVPEPVALLPTSPPAVLTTWAPP
ncbi:hypothetical protein D3C71_1589200 [compost metagenome]